MSEGRKAQKVATNGPSGRMVRRRAFLSLLFHWGGACLLVGVFIGLSVGLCLGRGRGLAGGVGAGLRVLIGRGGRLAWGVGAGLRLDGGSAD